MKTLKKSIFAILVVALAVSCNGKKDVNYALISGKITNANGNVMVTQNRKKVKEITVKEDGTFKDTIFNPEGYYNFSHSRETTPIYLQNGDELTITLDTKQFDETVTYKGYGADENNYLAQKFLTKEKELGDIRALFKLDEDAFLEKQDLVKTKLEKALRGLGGEFAKSEQKKSKYEYAVNLLNYERYHRILTENRDFKVSEKFPKPLEGMDLENEEDFKKYDSYKQLVLNNFYNGLADEKDKEKALVEKITKMKDGEIKNTLIGSLARSIDNASEENQKLYDAVMKLSKDDKLKNELKSKMDKFKKLVKGNPSPVFENYENYKGGKTSLKDFKGKYVYIDVWATWCGPCKREIPFMKKVEKKYHGKKIAFVSISVDDLKKKDAWKKMVKEKEMAGVQLFSDKSWGSDFVQGYQINEIILAVFVMALMVSCEKKEKVNYALVSGKIENTSGTEIEIRTYKKKVKKIKLSQDGSFKDTIFNPKGHYYFMTKKGALELYLDNGFDIQITLDANQFYKTVTYKGRGNEVNTYLLKFNPKVFELKKQLYTLEETAFLKKVDSFQKEVRKEIKGLDANFVKKQNKVLDYQRAIYLGNYEVIHKRVTKNKDFKVSNTFPNPLENIDLENNKDFDEFSIYQQLIENVFSENVEKEVARSGKEYYKVALEKIRTMKEGSIRNSLLYDLLFKTSNEDAKKEIFGVIMELSTDEKLKKKFKKVAKGNPSPTFENYENYKGGTTSLKDFEGKFVYIDVWATWCPPCRKQIPFMKKIEEKYHKKDIVFISISVDDLEKKEVWKQMVKEKEMAGVQLFADKSFDSDFIKNYSVNSIPRFIFLDKKGKIIDANAPRPSEPKLMELFKEYGL